MEKTELISGVDDSEGNAAFSRDKMEALGIDSMTLSRVIAESLRPFAPLLGDGKGFGLIVHGDSASIVGINDGDSEGTDLIAAERRRQIDAEGWTLEHDDDHADGSMAAAAAAYAFSAFLNTTTRVYAADPAGFWPWDTGYWNPKDPDADLIRAGALCAAELDRRARARAKGGAA